MSEPLTHPLWKNLAQAQRQNEAEEAEEAHRIHKQMLRDGFSDSTARRQRLVEAVERRRAARAAKEMEP